MHSRFNLMVVFTFISQLMTSTTILLSSNFLRHVVIQLRLSLNTAVFSTVIGFTLLSLRGWMLIKTWRWKPTRALRTKVFYVRGFLNGYNVAASCTIDTVVIVTGFFVVFVSLIHCSGLMTTDLCWSLMYVAETSKLFIRY